MENELAEKKRGIEKSTKKIVPHFWFDKEAKEAAKFYTSIFKGSRVKNTSMLHNTPSGLVDIVTIELSGREFMLISAGPLFKFNPSVSFLVACETKEEVDTLWEKLSEGGLPLMPLDKYPFSERYGWIQDKYGVSWQVVPTIMEEIMQSGDDSKIARVTEEFLKMKKLDIAVLQKAYGGK
jgi:predicted 3-demethylubiquinone-9 3-methyltransferase (glyoxalase superfamily)